MEVAVDAWLRWTRAAVLSAVACLVAVGAHVTADGRLPSATVLVLVWAALTVAAQPLLARPASAVRVVVLTVGGQALAHAALSATGGHGTSAHSAHHAHAVEVPMVVTHLVAAALVGLWLAVGEKALWSLLSLAWRALALVTPSVAASLPPGRATTATDVIAPLRRLTAGAVVRRGPPLLLAA